MNIEFSPDFYQDIARIQAHMVVHGIETIEARIEQIFEAIAILAHSPYMGRPVEDDLRELVIGRRSRGYMALYDVLSEREDDPDSGVVVVHAIRSQAEAGYH